MVEGCIFVTSKAEEKMTFWCEGRPYVTSGMKQFLTKDPGTPLILLTPDYRKVFVMTLEGCRGYRIHQASTVEIIALATRNHLPELLEAFPAPTVGDVHMDESADAIRSSFDGYETDWTAVAT
jgi:hypothetical protein